MDAPKAYYKYRSYSARSLELFIRREIYFAPADKLNDPYDCRVSIKAGLREAIEQASGTESPELAEKLKRFMLIEHVYDQMERDIGATGIFSLSEDPTNVLMWSHYAANHEGFCIGFQLSEQLSTHNSAEGIVGLSPVLYCKGNPFGNYFEELAREERRPEWSDFWMSLLSIGMTAKGESWGYEKEARIIRKTPGVVPFHAAEVSEIIFGLNMPKMQREVIRNVLAGSEWSHVQFSEIKHGRGFNVEKVSIA